MATRQSLHHQDSLWQPTMDYVTLEGQEAEGLLEHYHLDTIDVDPLITKIYDLS